MTYFRRFAIALAFFMCVVFSQALAQFEEPTFEKVTNDPKEKQEYLEKFGDIKWTGQGLYQPTSIDDLKANEIRSRLQAEFGDPTQTLQDLIDQPGFRPGKAIQFEYWFTVDDSIPMMVLDEDGPFRDGLVYVGSSRYIDLMPQIKRTLSKKLMKENPAEFKDYFYSPERGQWYEVAFRNGEFATKKIDSPDGMSVDFK